MTAVDAGARPGGAEAPRSRKKPTLVFFYSDRSGASRRAEGFLAQVLQRRGNHDTFRLARVEVDERPDLVERFGVREVPTLLVVADQRVCARVSTPRGCVEITQGLAPWLR
jgi:thioredoxin-like negative regulator of GroEL